MRKEDEEERKAVECFIENECGCKQHCNNFFSFEEVSNLRADNFELSMHERDLFLKGQIRTFFRPKDDNKKSYIDYHYHGLKICQHSFLFINGITLKYFKTILEKQRKLIYSSHHVK